MSERVLDDAEARRTLDPGGMLDSVAGLPQQCRDAWLAATREAKHSTAKTKQPNNLTSIRCARMNL